MTTSFVAYPSNPPAVGETITAALAIIAKEHAAHDFRGWEENDIAGRFIAEPILGEIEEGDVLSADITRLNFNVTYEIGYAIGKEKRLFLVKNGALTADDSLVREIGIFDTLGYKTYNTSRQLVSLLTGLNDLKALPLEDKVDQSAPVYALFPKVKVDNERHLLTRLKRAFRSQFRTFDPDEQGRLAAPDAIKNVAVSHGVVVPLLSIQRKDAQVHNMRAAFVAGLAAGMDKELLFLQFGEDPVPLDYRDLVKNVQREDQLDTYFTEFAPSVFARYGTKPLTAPRGDQSLLRQVNLGASSAENEMVQLSEYYLETEEFRRVHRGETQIVTGRKGSGKTALFVRLRDLARRHRQTIVLDLRPEGFQLLKFKEVVLNYLEQGTKEHAITAFWEYLLYLEICHKILEKDREPHLKDHTIYEPYRALAAEFATDTYIEEGDFAERMSKLMLRITREFKDVIGTGEWKARLSSNELTNILYQHEPKILRDKVVDYLEKKKGLWILFDNLDKGWPATGLGADDVLIIRCLIDAISKMEKFVRRKDIECHGVVFLRNDVYEILLNYTSDRGKALRAILDWTDPELLRELLRLRLVSAGMSTKTRFDEVWPQICVSHVGSQESSSYLIDRSLMRPRSLIDLLQYCRSHALNLGHTVIGQDDIREGEASYSTELVANIGLEIRDVFPGAGDVLYEFVGFSKTITQRQVNGALTKAGIAEAEHANMIDLLLWYGFLGVVRENGDIAYIYNVSYDKKRLLKLMQRENGDPAFYINPAFWVGLEIS